MLNIENLIQNENNDTFIVDKGEYGTIEVRNYLPGVNQDVFAEAVTKGVVSDSGYHPLRKAPYMLYVFMLTFVIDGDKMVVQSDSDVDLYETYRVLEEELGIMSAARKQSPSVDAILARIEENVDLMVYRELEYRNALLNAGLSVQMQECMMWVKKILMDVSETVDGVRKLSQKKTKELDGVLTKKNIGELMDTLRKLETVLAGNR